MTSRFSSSFPGNFVRTHLNNRIINCTYSNSGNLLGCGGHSYTYTTNNRVRTADGQVQFSYDGNDRLRETLVLGENRVSLDLRVEPLGRLSRFTGLVGGELSPETDWIYAMGQVVATLNSAQIAVPVGSSLRLTKDGPDVELDWATGRACENYIVRRSSNAQFSGQVSHDGLQRSAFTDSGAADPLVDRTNYFYLVESANPTPIRWYVRDHRGSTLLALDEQGEVAASYEYYPFGDIKSSTSSCENPGMLYQGSPRDERTGLDDLGARHYSSSLDRFLVPDSVWPGLTRPSNWNLYAYAANDPMNRIDVDGRIGVLVGDVGETLQEIRLGLPPGDRGAIQVSRLEMTGTVARVTLDKASVNAHTSDSGNFQALRTVINSEQTVEISSSNLTVPYIEEGGKPATLDMTARGMLGVTFPAGTGDYSSGRECTVVAVNPRLSQVDASATVHHELRAHASRFVQGLSIDHTYQSRFVNGVLMIRYAPNNPVNDEAVAAELEAESNAQKR